MFWLGIALSALGAALTIWSLSGRIRARGGRSIASAIYAPAAGAATKQYGGFVLMIIGGVLLQSRLH